MVKKSTFDKLFDDHLLLRDLIFINFVFVGFPVAYNIAIMNNWMMAIAYGVPSAILWLGGMEIWNRKKHDMSMFRYFFGGDLLEK